MSESVPEPASASAPASSGPPSSGSPSSAPPSSAPPSSHPGGLARLGADWIAVIVAGVLVVLAGLGLLPAIPFLIK